MPGPMLVGAKLYLRPLESADVGDSYVAWLNDREVTRYLETERATATREGIAEYLHRFEGGTDLIFAIVDKATGKHVGNVTLNRIDRVRGTADTGLMIGEKSFWGRGYAYEAWFLLIDYAFRELRLRKIIAGTFAPNEASLAVLRKLGFRVEGVLRGEARVDGEFVDVVKLGMFENEFAGRRPEPPDLPTGPC